MCNPSIDYGCAKGVSLSRLLNFTVKRVSRYTFELKVRVRTSSYALVTRLRSAPPIHIPTTKAFRQTASLLSSLTGFTSIEWKTFDFVLDFEFTCGPIQPVTFMNYLQSFFSYLNCYI